MSLINRISVIFPQILFLFYILNDYTALSAGNLYLSIVGFDNLPIAKNP